MQPSRGNVLVTRVATEETLGGGKILLPEVARDRITAYQMFIVSTGLPSFCGAPEDCENPTCSPIYEADDTTVLEYLHPIDPRIKEGAWCLVAPRSLVPSDSPDKFFVRIDQIEAVFTEEAE